ncbi:MAG: hypothetical protein Q8S73_26610 [Deltaproteobacteria bacterium]|nr:hypothetical protein [Myxococcales bacterium]MDP3217708.1 hypothetical protein [Deltaproteobacteria bacterium]
MTTTPTNPTPDESARLSREILDLRLRAEHALLTQLVARSTEGALHAAEIAASLQALAAARG